MTIFQVLKKICFVFGKKFIHKKIKLLRKGSAWEKPAKKLMGGEANNFYLGTSFFLFVTHLKNMAFSHVRSYFYKL